MSREFQERNAQVRLDRSTVSGRVPPTGEPGTAAVNLTDKALWVRDVSGTPLRMTRRIEDYSTGFVYHENDIVIRGNELWRALRTTGPGPLQNADWQKISFELPDSARAEPFTSGIILGGELTPIDATSATVGAGVGLLVDNTGDEEAVYQLVQWNDFTVPIPTGVLEPWIVVALDYRGIASVTAPSGYTDEFRREHIELAKLFIDPEGGSVRAVRDTRHRVGQTAEALRDALLYEGPYRISNLVLGARSGVTVTWEAGQVFAHGANWADNPYSPNVLDIGPASGTVINFTVVGRNTEVLASSSDVTLSQWDNNGTIESMPADTVSIRYAYMSPDGTEKFLQLGHTLYPDKQTAALNLDEDWRALSPYVGSQDLIRNYVVLGAMIFSESDTASSDLLFVNAQRGPHPFAPVYLSDGSGGGPVFDDSHLLALDGSRPMEGALDMGGNPLVNAEIDGQNVLIKLQALAATGDEPPAGNPTEAGEAFVNTVDRKVYVRAADGTPVLVADRIERYDATRRYVVGDFCVETDAFYICTTEVTAPEAFDPAKWQSLTGTGGGGGDLTDAVILEPDTLTRNEISTASEPNVHGLSIEGAVTQQANMLQVKGTRSADTGAWAIDGTGFPNARGGAANVVVSWVGHGFTSADIGTPVTVGPGNVWVLATGAAGAMGLLEEIIDSDTVLIRIAGPIVNLDPGAFEGGSITAGAAYYVSELNDGRLTTASGDYPPVLITLSSTTGIVFPSVAEAYLPLTGGTVAGALTVTGNLTTNSNLSANTIRQETGTGDGFVISAADDRPFIAPIVDGTELWGAEITYSAGRWVIEGPATVEFVTFDDGNIVGNNIRANGQLRTYNGNDGLLFHAATDRPTIVPILNNVDQWSRSLDWTNADGWRANGSLRVVGPLRVDGDLDLNGTLYANDIFGYRTDSENDSRYYPRATANSTFAYKNDAYTRGEADGRFVNVHGDTMTGNLNVNTDIFCRRYHSFGTPNGGAVIRSVWAGDVVFENVGYVQGQIDWGGGRRAWAAQDAGAAFTIACVGDNTSDASLKTNIRDSSLDALDFLSQVPLRAFDWVTNARTYGVDVDAGVPVGVVADEVESLVPGAVGEVEQPDGRKVKTVNYREFVPYLLKAVMELKEQNEALEARLAALEGIAP
jgi:uncharacterized cupin superfamily protein